MVTVVADGTSLQHVQNVAVQDADATNLGIVGDAHGAVGVVGGGRDRSGASSAVLIGVGEVVAGIRIVVVIVQINAGVFVIIILPIEAVIR